MRPQSARPTLQSRARPGSARPRSANPTSRIRQSLPASQPVTLRTAAVQAEDASAELAASGVDAAGAAAVAAGGGGVIGLHGIGGGVGFESGGGGGGGAADVPLHAELVPAPPSTRPLGMGVAIAAPIGSPRKARMGAASHLPAATHRPGATRVIRAPCVPRPASAQSSGWAGATTAQPMPPRQPPTHGAKSMEEALLAAAETAEASRQVADHWRSVAPWTPVLARR